MSTKLSNNVEKAIGKCKKMNFFMVKRSLPNWSDVRRPKG